MASARCLSMLLVASVLCIALLSAPVIANEGEVLSDAAIGKLRIKELVSFLADRGLECKGCSEKSDLVRMAIAHKSDAALSPEEKEAMQKEKDEAKEEKERVEREKREEQLAEMRKRRERNAHRKSSSSFTRIGNLWKAKVKGICLKECKAAEESDEFTNEFCELISSVADDKLSKMATGVMSVLGKQESNVARTSDTEPYLRAGMGHFTTWVKAAIAEKPDKAGLEKSYDSSKISKWILDVMMEKASDMFMDPSNLEEFMKQHQRTQGGGGGGRRPPPPRKPVVVDDEPEEHVEL